MKGHSQIMESTAQKKVRKGNILSAIFDVIALVGGVGSIVYLGFRQNWWGLQDLWNSNRRALIQAPAIIMLVFLLVGILGIGVGSLREKRTRGTKVRDALICLTAGPLVGAVLVFAMVPPAANEGLSYEGMGWWFTGLAVLLVIYVVSTLKDPATLRSMELYISLMGFLGTFAVMGWISSINYAGVPYFFRMVLLFIFGTSISGILSWYTCYSDWGRILSRHFSEAMWGRHLINHMFPEDQVGESINFEEFRDWPQPVRKELSRYSRDNAKSLTSQAVATDVFVYGLISALIVGGRDLMALHSATKELGFNSPWGLITIFIVMLICGVGLSLRNTYYHHLERMARDLSNDEESSADVSSNDETAQ